MRIVHKRRRDSQRAFPAGECRLCGGELYRGEICWRAAGRTLCGDCAGQTPGLAGGRLWEAGK